MWIALLKKYWLQLLLLLFLLVALYFAVTIKMELLETINERDQYKSGLEFQNATLLQQQKEYEEKLQKLPKEIEKITTKYEVIYSGIDNFIKDENETDCNASYRFLSTFNY